MQSGLDETFKLVIHQFVLDELNDITDSKDPKRRDKGRTGLESLSKIQKMSSIELTIPDSALEKGSQVEEKILFLPTA